MLRCLSIIALLASCLAASAQTGQPIKQSGSVTPSHALAWTTNGIAQDAGTAAVPFLTSIGTVGQGQTICAWSALSTAPGSQKICFGVSDSTGASLVIQNFGIDTPQPFSIVLNGTTYQFPYTVGGIVGPGTTVVGDFAEWNNTVGTLLKDVTPTAAIDQICSTNNNFLLRTAGTWGCSAFVAPRTPLTVDTTFYVNKDQGNNGNDCLSPGAGACATSGRVMTNISNLYDLKNITVTIQYGCASTPCTYTQLPFTAQPYVGSANINIVGDATTPDNFVMHLTSVLNCVFCFNSVTPGNWAVHGFKIDSAVGSGNGSAIYVSGSGNLVKYGNMDFGAMAGGLHLTAISGGQIENDASYTISGGAAFHAEAADNGNFHNVNGTITLTGTPAFSTALLYAHGSGAIVGSTTNWSGSATGLSCFADKLGLVDGIAGSLPGNHAILAQTYGVACGIGAVAGTDISGPINNTGVIFSALPTPVAGMQAYITDGKASNCGDSACTTWGTAVTGGTGALPLLIWYTGAAWHLVGK